MMQRPRRCWLPVLTLTITLVASLIFLPTLPRVYAHGGGTPRLTRTPVGPYRLYAWSEPWRVGAAHLSLAVTKLNPDDTSNQVELPATDVDITVIFTPISDNGKDAAVAPIVVEAVRQEFLSDFYYEADPTLTSVGDWQITVDVTGPDGSGSAQFEMQTLPERTLNWTLIASAGGVLVVILVLIALWSRAQQPAARHPQRRLQRRNVAG